MVNKKDICQTCRQEIEWLPEKELPIKSKHSNSKGRWIHSPFQKGQPISVSEAEELAEHEAKPIFR
jgi:hypothetical protein